MTRAPRSCYHDLALLRLLWLSDSVGLREGGDTVWCRVQCRLCELTIDMTYAAFCQLRALAPYADYDPYGVLRGDARQRRLPSVLPADLAALGVLEMCHVLDALDKGG